MKKPTQRIERGLHQRGCRFVAGVDEAGRGAWAGPIVAAAVILPIGKRYTGLRDSKQLTPRQREQWFVRIQSTAIAYQIVAISNQEIDRHGVGHGNREALRQAALQLPVTPDMVLVDAFSISLPTSATRAIVYGDATVVSIAAASILAKVTRDRIMCELHVQYPQYDFGRHKGYGTARHEQALRQHGPSPVHRYSYAPIRAMSHGHGKV